MLAVSMPNAETFSALVETATKCFATAASVPSCLVTQSRADVALVSVSRVPNVLDEMMNSVSSACRSRVASTKSVESTLDTKRNVLSRSRSGPRAAAGPAGEVGHPVEYVVPLAHYISAVHDQRLAGRHSQRDVQDGAVLG